MMTRETSTQTHPVAWGPGSNPYSYVHNAPTWLVDPTGESPQDKLRGSFDYFWDNTVQLVVDWNDQQSAGSNQRSVFSSMLNGWKTNIQDWIGGCSDSFDYIQTYGAWLTASLMFGAGEALAVTKTGSWGTKGTAGRVGRQLAKADDISTIGGDSAKSATKTAPGVADAAARRVRLRVGTKKAILDAQRAPNGKLYDPNIGVEIPEGAGHFGHRPGYEWWRTQKMAREQGWSRKQVIEYENDPTHYLYEDPRSNMSHRFEVPR